MHGSAPKIGVLLINLGTPKAASKSAIRSYLREFLSDPRVIEIPRPIWWLILNLFILPFRPGKIVHAYKKIWQAEGSPLAINTQQQAALLKKQFSQSTNNIIITHAMCYGGPSIAQRVDELLKENVQKLLIFPLYPQYSAATTAAAFDLVSQSLRLQRWIPELRFINQYYAEPAYITACANHLKLQRKHPERKLLFSFHGLPKRNLLMGDPYHCQCHASAYRIAQELGLKDEQWLVSFQSRFGRAEWLQPYTDKLLQSLPQQGTDEIDVFCPGFSADCLETLEEIAIQNRDFFLEAGGKSFTYLPALNASAEHIECLSTLINKHIAHWNEPVFSEEERDAAKARALKLGAS